MKKLNVAVTSAMLVIALAGGVGVAFATPGSPIVRFFTSGAVSSSADASPQDASGSIEATSDGDTGDGAPWTRQQGLDWWNSLPRDPGMTRVELGDGLTMYVNEETGEGHSWGNVMDEVSKNPFRYADALAGELMVEGYDYGSVKFKWDPFVGKRLASGRVVTGGEPPKDFTGWTIRGHYSSEPNFDITDRQHLFEVDGSKIAGGVAWFEAISPPIPICQKFYFKVSATSKLDGRVLESNPVERDSTGGSCDLIYAEAQTLSVDYAGVDGIEISGTIGLQTTCVSVKAGTYVYFRGMGAAFSTTNVFLEAKHDEAGNIKEAIFSARYGSELAITPGQYEVGMVVYNCKGQYDEFSLGKLDVQSSN